MCIYIYISIYMSIDRSIYLYIYISIYLSIYLISIYLSSDVHPSSADTSTIAWYVHLVSTLRFVGFGLAPPPFLMSDGGKTDEEEQ